MSLKINTNLQAMNALRNLSGTSLNLSDTMSRLSSGLRINTASDDPAGLVISEGMRAQIHGIDQAVRNSQDAINMAKTAEGGLSEIQGLLTSMRALAVHAANTAVVDANQLSADQGQIRSSLESINRIATSTQWGNKRLLDGTAGVTSAVINSTALSSAFFGSDFGDSTLISGQVTINQTVAALAATLTTGRTFANSSAVVPTTGSIIINGYSISSDGTDTVQSLATKINAVSQQTGVVAAIVSVGPNVSVRLTNKTTGSQFPLNLTDPNHILHTTSSVTYTGTDAQYDVTANTANGSQTVTFIGGRATGDSGLKLTDDKGNTITVTQAANDNWGSLFATPPQAVQIYAGSAQFQIGSEANQTIFVALPNVFTNNLGTTAVSGLSLADIDVSSPSGASDALKVIDEAITQIARSRGTLGSVQSNFLESNVRSLEVAKENVSASESAIRDVDMASELTRYTQLQILQQSGLAVLSQANQQPQSILKLLQGN
ncbi:MAG: hypothetical protein JST40_07150 [Armatimonadetes bacterium]|nr:hypothetical protein [Armatimonadota bacterium]